MNIFEQLQNFLFHKLPFLNEQEDVDVSSIDYVMNEPKREKIHSQSLNLHKNEGYHNILAVLKKATKAEIDYWGNWYEHAHNHVKQLAQKWDIPVEVCAGVCAVLSPNLGWKMNLMAADRTISNWKRMNGDETAQHYDKIPAYKSNVNKAYAILNTGDLSIVNGPKVTVFFQSLANPQQLQRDLVLDGHAINVWRGQKAALKNLKGLTKRERIAVIQDYKKVADIVGLTPQQVQAITWFIWKYVTDAPPSPKGKVRVKKPKETKSGVSYEGVMRKVRAIVEAAVEDELKNIVKEQIGDEMAKKDWETLLVNWTPKLAQYYKYWDKPSSSFWRVDGISQFLKKAETADDDTDYYHNQITISYNNGSFDILIEPMTDMGNIDDSKPIISKSGLRAEEAAKILKRVSPRDL